MKLYDSTNKGGSFAWYKWWQEQQGKYKPELAPPKQVEAFGFYRAIVWYLCTAGVLVGAYFLIRAWVLT